jgi:nucleotide-binding universal stress UspA family protein
MYRNVMVPTDGSDLSRHAIPLALAVARPANAVVHLVAVQGPSFEAPVYGIPLDGVGWTGGVAVDPDLDAEVRAARREGRESALRDFANRLAAEAGLSVTASLREGDIAPSLAAYAESHDIQLIVMATHGRGGLGRALLGSTADALVRSAPCPVMLARPHGELAHEAEPASIAHILVPLDESPASETVIPHAAAVAALTGARCTLVHASHRELASGIAAPEALLDPNAMAHVEEAERARLERVAEPLRARGVRVATEVLHVKARVDAIVEYAGTHAVDFIAMTTRAQHGLARLMRGSTATALLHRTLLPMLLARADTPAA